MSGPAGNGDQARPPDAAVDLKSVLREVDRALAAEHVDWAVRARILDRVLYGGAGRPYPGAPRHTAVAEMRVSADVLRQRHPQAVPEGLQYGVPNLLRRLYREAGDIGDPYAEGRVTSWDLRFEPNPGSPYGEHVLRAAADVQRWLKPVTVEEMTAEVYRLASMPREDPGGPQR